MRLTTLLAALGCLGLAAAAHAEPQPQVIRTEALCSTAILAAQPTSGLPQHLLLSIGRVESGRFDAGTRTVQPWPWSINAEGKGMSFPTREEAMAAVGALRARGVQSIDVGCMQINLLHHPAAFASLDEAFDPVANVRYAIRFLGSLHAETRDWALAAAYYHSRTVEFAAPYQQRVLAGMPGGIPGGAILVATATTAAGPRAAPVSPLANAWASTMGAATAAPAAGWMVAGGRSFADGPVTAARRPAGKPILLASRH